MLELIDYPPHIIFTTAFDEYAIKAFELNAIDYLLKPFSKDRFIKALNKCFSVDKKLPIENINKLNNQIAKDLGVDKIIVKNKHNIHVIPVEEIVFISSEDDYVMINTKENKYL